MSLLRLRFRGPVAGKGALGATRQALGVRARHAGARWITLALRRNTSDPRGGPRRRIARGKALLDSLVDGRFAGIVVFVITCPGLLRALRSARCERGDQRPVTGHPPSE